MRFAEPTWLLAGLAAALAWWIVLLSRRAGRTLPWCSAAMTSLAILLLAGALAKPEAKFPGRAGLWLLVAEDISASQADASALALDTLNMPARRYVFAGAVGRSAEGIDPDQTRLGPVLSLIAARADELAGAVIVTDGRIDDHAGLSASAEAIRQASLPLMIVPRAPGGMDVRLADLRARRTAEGSVHLTATVTATAGGRCTLEITRDEDEAPLLIRDLTLLPGSPATVRLIDRPADRATTYRAEVRAENDLLTGNNRLAVRAEPSQPRILLCGASAAALPIPVSDGASIEPIAPPEMPKAVEPLLTASLVIVADPTGRLLSPLQRDALAGYVRMGGGLVMLGTGPAEDPNDPLNTVLALRPTDQQRRRLDVVVLLDASGSMNELQPRPDDPAGPTRRRFDLARDATLALARRQLTASDRLRVLTFKGRATEQYLGPGGPESLSTLSDALDAVTPSSGTALAPALAAALATPPAEGLDRLIIVLSDLQTEDFDPAGWADRLSEGEAALAVAATGLSGDEDDPDQPLVQLARRMSAPLVYQPDLATLAEVFAEFVREARGDLLRRRETSVEIVGPLFGRDVAALPDVGAFLALAAQEDAELLARTEAGEPLLARRRVAQGRCVSLAVPLAGPWNQPWRQSPAVAELFAGMIEWGAMPAGDPRYTGWAERDGDRLVVRLTRDQPIDPAEGPAMTAQWVSAERSAEPVAMRQVAPAEFEARLPSPGDAPAGVMVRGGDGRILWHKTISARYPAEFEHVGVDRAALARLAEITGGRVIEPDQLPAITRSIAARGYRPIWPILVIAAAVVMLLDWVTTRLVHTPPARRRAR